jgi:hypothetical protein
MEIQGKFHIDMNDFGHQINRRKLVCPSIHGEIREKYIDFNSYIHFVLVCSEKSPAMDNQL